MTEPMQFFPHLFQLLLSEPGARLGERRAIVAAAREYGLVNGDLKTIYGEWIEARNTGSIPEPDPAIILPLYAFLLADETIEERVGQAWRKLAVHGGLPAIAADALLGAAAEARSVKSFADRVRFLEGLAKPSAAAAPREASLYIANQLTPEGFDELQRLFMARTLGLHVAIDGPPGVGKTQCVREIARFLGQPIFTKTCSGRTNESHIIAYPVLAVDSGASYTRYENGPLCQALECGGIFYGDEFNQLKEDVQKRLNSAFDDRREIDRADGVLVKAKPGFWGVISYNPSEDLGSRDLEDSVADRFVHLPYHRWSSDFKACIAVARARGLDRNKLLVNNDFGITLGLRGIDRKLHFYNGIRKGGETKWHDFFSGEEVDHEPEYIYLVHDDCDPVKRRKQREMADALSRFCFDELSFARILSRFTDTLQSLKATGESPLLAKLGMGDLKHKEDLELLSLHESSARIEMAALKHHRLLIKKGCPPYFAQAYATRIAIDQICFGKYRNRKLREKTTIDLVWAVARSFSLINNSTQFNTGFVTKSLLEEADK